MHTNDMHCDLDNGVGLSSVSWLKQKYEKKNLPVILVDAGDAVQGGLLGSLTNGQAVVRLMNLAEYDFAIPGNHEFDYGMEQFKLLNEQLNCHYYSANITKAGKLILHPYKIFDFDGRKIAFIGVTTPNSLKSVNPKSFADVKNPRKIVYGFKEGKKGNRLYNSVQLAVNKAIKDGANKVILVAHFGNNDENWNVRKLIKHLHNIDAVIDGHSHVNYIEQFPDMNGKSVIVSQTGCRLQTLGKLVISDDGVITADKIDNILGKDLNVKNKLDYETNLLMTDLQKVLGHCEFDLCTDNPTTGKRMVRNAETNLGDFVTDAFRNLTGADIAIINGGALRSALHKGDISCKDVLNVLPFDNPIYVANVTGKQLAEILEYSVRIYPEETGSFLQVSGISFDVNSNQSSGVIEDAKGFLKIKGNKRRVSNIYIGANKLVMKKIYTIAGPSFLLKNCGDGYSMFRKLDLVKKMPVLDRDAVQKYLSEFLLGKVPDLYKKYNGQERIKII
ncbi:MAG: bifunctional metallophosphatase/5'-nucleotidase [Acidaminococcaceae bacterium]|nr:bifunctional metallophosphatase/5'-nucleotidase [Acidaminococcaceae bacterium]